MITTLGTARFPIRLAIDVEFLPTDIGQTRVFLEFYCIALVFHLTNLQRPMHGREHFSADHTSSVTFHICPFGPPKVAARMCNSEPRQERSLP